ncbi:MAG: trypsin-like peptidase domain-containing protein [Caldilineaceae bacterium]
MKLLRFTPKRAAHTRLLAVCALLLLLASSVLVNIQPAYAMTREARARALMATVLIVVPDNSGRPYSSGSGTIMDAENGYILSNYHVIGDVEKGKYYNKEGMTVIGIMPNDLKGAPTLKYLAQVVTADPELDLSLLKIVALYDNQRAPLPNNLGLTEIPRGNFDDLQIGDDVAIFGYPGIGGSTVTYTEGKISGFNDDDQNGDYEWAKTDASASHGNSGGLATNANGEFIGVPTQVASEADTAANLTRIRNGNIAINFMERALMGTTQQRGSGPRSGPKVEVPGSPIITKVEFGAAINRSGEITRPGVRFASGTTDLYAAFSYENFQDGSNFSYSWTHNGEEIASDNVDWSEGRQGSNWVSLNNDRGLDDGKYELIIQVDGAELFRGSVAIGAQQAGANARFGRIVFAENVDDKGQAINPASSFSGVTAVYAVFDVAGMEDGTVWTTRWYYQDEEVASEENVWEFGKERSHYVWLEHPDGLPNGTYKLELYIEGKLSQSGEFQVGARSQRQQRNQVTVVGQVTDADNKRLTISGALVIFLNPGISINQWVDANYDETMIYAQGTTDRNGEYQLDKRVERGSAYSIVVYRDGYETVTNDDYEIPADADDPYALDATLQKQ